MAHGLNFTTRSLFWNTVNLKNAARKVWDVSYRTERITEILES